MLDDFQLLIEDAMSVTDEVVVSSLCPRLDDSRANRMVVTVNARLQGLVEGLGCVFVSHVRNFYDEDEVIKSGLLDDDGLHSSSLGSACRCGMVLETCLKTSHVKDVMGSAIRLT